MIGRYTYFRNSVRISDITTTTTVTTITVTEITISLSVLIIINIIKTKIMHSLLYFTHIKIFCMGVERGLLFRGT
jgi:hypothetical protein